MSWGATARHSAAWTSRPSSRTSPAARRSAQSVVAGADDVPRRAGGPAVRHRVPGSEGNVYEWGSNSLGPEQPGGPGDGVRPDRRPAVPPTPSWSRMDYLLGRNALNNSYVTGYGDGLLGATSTAGGSPTQMEPSLPNPPPGSVAGGPNSNVGDVGPGHLRALRRRAHVRAAALLRRRHPVVVDQRDHGQLELGDVVGRVLRGRPGGRRRVGRRRGRVGRHRPGRRHGSRRHVGELHRRGRPGTRNRPCSGSGSWVASGRTWSAGRVPTLSFAAVLADNGSQYRAYVANAFGGAYTEPATLTVTAAPAATGLPGTGGGSHADRDTDGLRHQPRGDRCGSWAGSRWRGWSCWWPEGPPSPAPVGCAGRDGRPLTRPARYLAPVTLWSPGRGASGGRRDWPVRRPRPRSPGGRDRRARRAPRWTRRRAVSTRRSPAAPASSLASVAASSGCPRWCTAARASGRCAISATARATSRSRAARRVRTFSMSSIPPSSSVRIGRSPSTMPIAAAGMLSRPPRRRWSRESTRNQTRVEPATVRPRSATSAPEGRGARRVRGRATRHAPRRPVRPPPGGLARRRRSHREACRVQHGEPERHGDRTGVDHVDGHGRRLGRELGCSDRAREVTRQVDRDDLARTGRRCAVVGRGEGGGRRLRRRHLGARGEGGEQVARRQVDAFHVPHAVDHHVQRDDADAPPLGRALGQRRRRVRDDRDRRLLDVAS